MSRFDLPPNGYSSGNRASRIMSALGRHFQSRFMLWVATALIVPHSMAGDLTNAILLEIEGKAILSRAGAAVWDPAYTNAILFPGDRLRTLGRSRALVRLSDLSLLRLSELTHLQIPIPTDRRGGFNLHRGLLYYFHRDKPGVMPVTTPTAYAVVLGTEFTVEVTDEGNTRITLIEGLLGLTNEFGGIAINSGETATVNAGTPPLKAPASNARRAIQWVLYYPGVLDPDGIGFTDAEQIALRESLEAYRAGDLRGAMRLYPAGRQPASDRERVYVAALLLTIGQVQEAERIIDSLVAAAAPDQMSRMLAAALQRVIAAVRFEPLARTPPPPIATALLAESYLEQSRSDLGEALALARRSVEASPNFSFGWARVAELEFSFGRIGAARTAVARAIELAPHNAQAIALQGFLMAAANDMEAALRQFDQAISLDGALGNAWFGRGLCRIREGKIAEGREDLQVAATLEPQRAVFRSYLGKAFATAGDWRRATNELAFAKALDPLDPAAWLYSALMNQQLNRINQGVDDLEHSLVLNQQRSVFRSSHLLDQDRAVRSANLAGLYQDAGMSDVSVHEAARAVDSDYANYSAHAFLAESFNERRDPNLVNLRYETATFSEYLMANLLAPVGGTVLSPQVSQQEYSRLFERDRIGLSSATAYASDGSWAQSASQFGTLDSIGYALDVNWRSQEGHRPNNDLNQLVGSGQFKFQLTPQDSIYVQTMYGKVEAGDLRQFADDSDSSRTLRVEERQEPNLFAGYHHQWAAGVHTLLLGAWLDDTLLAQEPNAFVRTLVRDSGGTLTGQVSPPFSQFDLDYRSEFTAWSGELQQIFQSPSHTVVAGLRYQSGKADTRAMLGRDPTAFPPVFTSPAANQAFEADLERATAYAYYKWQVVRPLSLVAGMSYDHLRHPDNIDHPPIIAGEESHSRISPKAGLTWVPGLGTTVRGAYTRSLGGAYYDNSIRLEPTHVAGFVQSYRSLAPESVTGPIPGTQFETTHLGVEQKLSSRTYALVEAEWLRSEGARSVGVFDYTDAPPFVAVPSTTRQRLDFDERSVAVSLHQLIGEDWSLGAKYRFSRAELEEEFTSLSTAIIPEAKADQRSSLHEFRWFALWQNAAGFFGRGEAVWRAQNNRSSLTPLTDEDFWQFNLLAGVRLGKRRTEIAAGVLNVSDRNYRLSPLSGIAEPPRERTFVMSLKFNL